MISVEEAFERLSKIIQRSGDEIVPLQAALGRVLAHPAVAQRTQPPFTASAMDGYALKETDVAPGSQLQVIGEARAGKRFSGGVQPGEAVRIFTGAPIPDGADRVVIQEDVIRDGASVTLADTLDRGRHIRPAGGDFSLGERISAPKLISARDIGLFAAMNLPQVTVAKRPTVVIISTGDELVAPGGTPGPDQIISSNAHAIAALVSQHGGQPRILPIAPDTHDGLSAVFDLAEGADFIITLGGASVGEHDIVAKTAQTRGLLLDFYKIAMRPGKPFMAGRMGDAILLGLPGNPVSAYVCALIFLVPMLKAAQGLPFAATPTQRCRLAAPLAQNGARAHYMRAEMTADGVRAATQQDSALLKILAQSDVLIVRPAFDPERAAGEQVNILNL